MGLYTTINTESRTFPHNTFSSRLEIDLPFVALHNEFFKVPPLLQWSNYSSEKCLPVSVCLSPSVTVGLWAPSVFVCLPAPAQPRFPPMPELIINWVDSVPTSLEITILMPFPPPLLPAPPIGSLMLFLTLCAHPFSTLLSPSLLLIKSPRSPCHYTPLWV